MRSCASASSSSSPGARRNAAFRGNTRSLSLISGPGFSKVMLPISRAARSGFSLPWAVLGPAIRTRGSAKAQPQMSAKSQFLPYQAHCGSRPRSPGRRAPRTRSRARVIEQVPHRPVHHGAVHAELFDVVDAPEDVRGNRPRGLELDRRVLVDVDLADDLLELAQLLDELLCGDRPAEGLVDTRPGHHGLPALRRRLDLGMRPLKEPLPRID